MIKKFKNNKLKCFLLIVFLLILLFQTFYKIDSYPIEYWDEGTNAIVVSNLEQSDNFLDLEILEGESFYEKPPLWYYFTYFSVNVFGYNLFSLRLVSAIAGIILTLLVFEFTRRRYGFNAGIVSGFVLLTTRHFFFSNLGVFSTHTMRSADLDVLQILFIFISFLFLWRKKSWVDLVFMGVFSGLAVLTKGPFGFLPFIIYILTNLNTPKSIVIKNIIIGAIPMLMTILPWHLAMYLTHGYDFIDKYINYHILSRSTQSIEGHSQPFDFYIKLLLNPNIFAFGSILFTAIFFEIKSKIFDLQTKGIVATIIFVVILISIIPTKLAWYLLYIYPFAAILIGKFYSQIPTLIKKYKNITIVIFSFTTVSIYFGNMEPNIVFIYLIVLALPTIFLTNLKYFFLINIVFIIILNTYSFTNLEKADIQILLDKNHTSDLKYIYSEDLNRSDWYYLEKNDVPWERFSANSNKKRIITRELWLLDNEEIRYNIISRVDNIYLIEITSNQL